eukprot:PhM_4_TR6197/c0_g1_i1/m.43369/K03798/ftsH, hflB; cell division protease FtsH
MNQPPQQQQGSLYQSMMYNQSSYPQQPQPMHQASGYPQQQQQQQMYPQQQGGFYGPSSGQGGYQQQQQQYVPPPPAPQTLSTPYPSQPQTAYDPYGNPFPAGPGADDYFKGFHDGTVKTQGLQMGSAASWAGPLIANLILFVVPVWYIRRRMMNTKTPGSASELMEMFNPLKSRDFRVDVKGTNFKDVIGVDEAKEEVRQYVDFLKDPGKYTKLGGRLPKGCLLTGRPGTGKTLLAKAVAGEANVPFFSCSGADFIEVFGGSGPKRVRELFQAARSANPCVVFIDEIDAIGSRGGGRGMGGSSSEENRTINQLLSELDGMQGSDNIIVMAATNFPDAIDKALLREGRFDRKVTIPMPDGAARRELFDFYLTRIVTGDKNCKPQSYTPPPKRASESTDGNNTTTTEVAPITPEVVDVPGVNNVELAVALSDRTPGVSPAQIATIVNEAALTSAVSGEKYVSLKYLQDAIDDVLIGKKHRQRMSDLALKRTAYHEVGHCIMAWTSPLQKDVIKLSIIPRGRAGGYTQQVQEEALDPHTNVFLFSQLCVLAGGRVAEQLTFGDVSTGAMDDLQRATKVALDKLLLYGMSKGMGHLSFKHDSQKSEGRGWMPFSEDLHAEAEAEARAMVDRAFKHTEEMLMKNNDKLVALAELLLEKKELDRAAIEKVLGPRPAVAAT